MIEFDIEADVYRGNQLVAHLRRTRTGVALEFVAEVDMVSHTLPHSTRPVEASPLHAFFMNLLPEGRRLQLLMERGGRAKDDLLPILLQTGADMIGDISVFPHGADPITPKPQGIDPREADFLELFEQAVGAKPDNAIAGVQEKISDRSLHIPISWARSGHTILKLDIMSFPGLLKNEHFFMKAARRCGLDVPKTELIQDRNGICGLLVERFDRVWEARKSTKLHQEDLAQLLGTFPANKYDVSMRQIAEKVTELCSAPASEMLRLLQLYIYSYLIGNGDLHAKNVSLLWKKGLIRLSPGYDLLSTVPYSDSNYMALKLDGKDDGFTAKSFEDFGERFGLPRSAVTKLIARLVPSVLDVAEDYAAIGYDAKTTRNMQRVTYERAEKLYPR